jgi:hypothetical protein
MRPSVPSRLIQAVAALAIAAVCAAGANAAPPASAPVPPAPAKGARPAAATKKVVAKAPLPAKPAAAADSSREMMLKGGEEGTVFRTLTVQGEDRIHIEVERPELQLDMDPAQAPGLDRGTVRDVLDRTTPDLEAPLLASTSRDASQWVAHPWLAHFPEGAVARFRPAVTNVERWRLLVVNARAESVAVFRGEGDPPREIAWDGRSSEGTPVFPGASYSYVFEAHDKAGNKRNFVGEGFRVSAFRYETPQGPILVFAGTELERSGGAAWGADEPPPIVLQLASELNQEPSERRVRIEVTARSAAEANALGGRLMRWMSPHLIGDPARLESVGFVASDAPAGAAVKVSTETP